MEKAINQPTTKVIALRFDTVEEAEYLESVLEANLKITADQGRPKEADELLKALKDCIKLFRSRSDPSIAPERDDLEHPTDYQREPADPKKEYMDKIHGKEENK